LSRRYQTITARIREKSARKRDGKKGASLMVSSRSTH
jgi:hypothetical protein